MAPSLHRSKKLRIKEEEDAQSEAQIRYVPRTHVYSASAPCINTRSRSSMSKAVGPYDSDNHLPDPSRKCPPVLLVYRRRPKRPRIAAEIGGERGSNGEAEGFVGEGGGSNQFHQNVELGSVEESYVDEVNCQNRGESVELEVASNKRVSLRIEKFSLGKEGENPKARSSASFSKKKWAELSIQDVDQNVLVGLACKVYWPLDEKWYTGSITEYNLETQKHQIEYDDGDTESLSLSKEKVKFYVSPEEKQHLNLKLSNPNVVKKDHNYDELLALAAALDDCQEREPGDVIWAKVTGHSMWPAIVVAQSSVSACKGLRPTSGEGSVPVQFFGTHDFARISTKQVISFLRGLLSSFHTKCKQMHFDRSLEEAKMYLSQQKLPEKMLRVQNGFIADDSDNMSTSDEDEEAIDSDEDYLEDGGVQECICPFKIGDLRVISLGKIVRDSEHFYSKQYIWPEGYTARRKYVSTTDPSKSTFYKMEVLRNPQSKARPLFRVTSDNGVQIDGSTPYACWKKIYKKINLCSNMSNGFHTKEGEISGTFKSGSYMFGFSIQKISKLIQELCGAGLSKSLRGSLAFKGNLGQPVGYRPVRVDWKDLEKCNVCHMDEEYENNLFMQCDKCLMTVHSRCYGEESKDGVLWLCNLCRDGAPRCPPPCCLCPVTGGGAMKPTTDGRWAHLTCAMWIPETFLLDVNKMEPIDGLERISKDRWKLLCNICGVSYGACIQCSNSNCRVAYHPLCARASGLCVELEDEDRHHLKSSDDDDDQQCIRLLSFCKKHRQPSNGCSIIEEQTGQAARSCSRFTPPSNPSGCARSEPYNFLGRRGRKEPEALAAVSAKRLYVENRPYFVSGYRQNKSLFSAPFCNELVLTSISSSRQKMRTQPETPESVLSMAEKYKYMRGTFRKRLVFGKSGIHGFGIFAKQAHKAGDMIIEYIGELVRPPVADLREHFIYNSLVGAGTYMFRIDDERVIDATRAGSIAHLINHSCEPNCYSRVVNAHGNEHIIIFAKRDIIQWEELTYDYRFSSAEEKLACYCGFPKCRGVVNDIEAEEQVAKIRVPRSELIDWRGE